MIQPSDYIGSISAYISWQNKTVQYFIEQYRANYLNNYYEKEEWSKIEQTWNSKEQSNEGIFFGGATRPLLLEKITHFSALLSSYYDKSDVRYTKNRSNLFDALCQLVRIESSKYWIP